MPTPLHAPNRWLRPRNFILAFLLLLGALVIWIGSEVYWAYTVEPGHAVNFSAKVREIAAGMQQGLTGDDAWPFLEDAIAAERKAQEEARQRYGEAPDLPPDFVWPVDYSSVSAPNSPEAIRTQTERLIADLRAAGMFQTQARLVSIQRMERPIADGPLLEMLLPELGSGRQLARLGGARMFLAARDSDGPAQVAAFEETLAVGRLLALQPPLISHLVGIAIDALALGELRFELTQHPPDAATLRALIQALERQTPLSPMVPHIECERNFCLDIIQMTYSDDGHGSGRYLPYQASKLGIIGGSGLAPKMPGSRLVNLRGIIMPRKAAAVALVNAHFDSVVSAAAAPIGKRAAADVDGMFIAHQTGYEVINAILPALGKYFQSCDQFEADLRGTRLMLAIELYKADKGEYPAALSDLTPVYAPEVLPDPISGMPFVYRRLQPGEDASGRLYLLYSCGPDKKDNGGKADPSSQHPNARAGFDWIINQPRPKPANPTEPPAPPPAKTDLPSPPP